jgi:hypothetical protein
MPAIKFQHRGFPATAGPDDSDPFMPGNRKFGYPQQEISGRI